MALVWTKMCLSLLLEFEEYSTVYLYIVYYVK